MTPKNDTHWLGINFVYIGAFLAGVGFAAVSIGAVVMFGGGA